MSLQPLIWPNNSTVHSLFQLTGPSSPPTNLTVSSTSHTNITFIWGRVPCVDRNAEVTQYVGRYTPTARAGSGDLGFTVTDSSNRMHIIMGLIPRTSYTIQVEASHIDLSVSPPVFLTGPPATVTSVTEPSPGNYINMRWPWSNHALLLVCCRCWFLPEWCTLP